MPEGVESFTVEDAYNRFGPMVRDPEGQVVWHDEDRTASAEIAVPTEHQGKLWRIVGEGFKMDSKIPPYYSVDRDRWFNPERMRQGPDEE